MQPTFSDVAEVVRQEAGIRTDLPCFLLRGVFSRGECVRIIHDAEEAGFQAMGGDYPPSYRDNDRRIRDDAALAEVVFVRIRPFLPERIVDASGDTWRLRGLNPRFRFCRYRGGQRFSVHRDGAYAPSPEVRSHLTCMLYLNDSGEFSGGATRYYAERSEDSGLLGVVRPEAGTLIVFDHELWHDGEAVASGTKYVMRTDVLYARESVAPGDTAEVLTGHQGYVWHVLARRNGSLATASRDGTVRLWQPSGNRWRPDAVLTGHTGSVVALAEDAEGRLWSASRDRTVRRWEGSNSQVIGRHDGAVLCLAALPNGDMASGGADGAIRLWSPEGEPRGVLKGHMGWIWALVPLEGGLLASASEDGTVRLWHTASTSEASAPVQTGAPVRALAALPSGGLISGQATGELSMWQLAHAPRLALELRGTRRVHAGAVCTIAPLSEGRVASGGEDDGIHLTYLPDFTVLASHHHTGFVRSLAVLPGGRLASASYDTTVRLWPAPREAITLTPGAAS
ncbi:2OG-Fe(II) oxygenase [Hyalangium sp.]|uniref:2OG-Fe(II) oxygenase n=1 Tax=Hyalangium sp. TaxID=2028555 RepID=UPI002D4B8A74|nr:2OG-Fe(II) oxygenase [Hyalangium sp.]HYH96866.1 2OG-Fe(II) oxygenase [Hyalangium sp.]